jgi:hypothetical protein
LEKIIKIKELLVGWLVGPSCFQKKKNLQELAISYEKIGNEWVIL